MTEYYEEGGLLYEQSPPMHIKVESPEGPLGGGGASEDGFPREDEDSEGSCENSGGGGGGGGALPGGLPFNVVVVHPNIMAPGMSSDDLLSLEHNRGMSAALAAAGGAGKRKSRFSGAELEVLVSEVTRCEGELFGPAGRLRRRERERIWAGILERVNAVSRVPRTLREVKKRWDDLKRRNGGRLADARHRTCYLPSGRGSSGLGRPSQASPRLQQQGRSKHSTRAKISFPCFTDSDPGGGDGSERDGLEKDEDNPERDGRDLGDPDCDGGPENSMEEKLGLGLGLGIGPPPPSERWLPPSPLYSAPFFNGSPPPSPQPSLGPQPGPLEAPPRGSWLEEELRVLGEAAVQLGDRVEKSLRDFSEGFRRDLRTLVSSQESLAVSLQQNNLLLQRLLGVLEQQQQQAPPAAPQPPHHPHPHPHPHPRVQQAHQTQLQHVNPPAQQPPTQTQTQLLQPVEPQPQLEQQLQTHTAQQQQQQQLPRRSNNPSAAAAATSASAVVATSSPPPPEMHTGTFRSDLPLPPAAAAAAPPPPAAAAGGVNGTLQQQQRPPRRGRTVDHRRRRRR